MSIKKQIKLTTQLPVKYSNGQLTYPGLAETILSDDYYGPKVHKRCDRLLAQHPEGLLLDESHWYFGYLVSAFTQVNYGIKTLRNEPNVSEDIFRLLFTPESMSQHPGGAQW